MFLIFFILYIFSKYAHHKLQHHPSNPTTLAAGRVFKNPDFASYQVFIVNVFKYKPQEDPPMLIVDNDLLIASGGVI